MPTIKQLEKEVEELEKEIKRGYLTREELNFILGLERCKTKGEASALISEIGKIEKLKATKRHLEHLKEMRERVDNFEFINVEGNIARKLIKAELFGEE